MIHVIYDDIIPDWYDDDERHHMIMSAIMEHYPMLPEATGDTQLTFICQGHHPELMKEERFDYEVYPEVEASVTVTHKSLTMAHHESGFKCVTVFEWYLEVCHE
jgi:hypothetical protein